MALALSALERVQRRRNRAGRKVAVGVKPNKREAAKYNRELQIIVNMLIEETNNNLPSLLKKLESQFVTDGYAVELNRAILAMSSRARNISSLAKTISSEWVNGVNNQQRKQFYSSIQRSIGVDLQGIVSEEGLTDILEAKVGENVSLIQSLPDEYYKKINNVINNLTTRGTPANSIIRELQNIGISTKKRARLIARDQTQKLNAAITQNRQEALGIEEYEWQTSDDERVRPTHRRNNGKTFRWDDPPKETGHPGQDINCRCVPLPIINLERTRRAS